MATVDTLIADARGFADTSLTAAQDALSTLQDQVASIGYTVVTPGAPNLPAQPVLPELPALPTIENPDFTLPDAPAPLADFADIGPIEVGTEPTLEATMPDVVLPSTPSALAEFADVAPTLDTSIVFPDVPAMLLDPQIDAPTITDRPEPERPETALPVFDSAAPTDDTQAPTQLAERFELHYRDLAPNMRNAIDGHVDAWLGKINPQFHTQLAALEAQLARFLEGGTGFKPEVEDAIYERSKDKVLAEARRVQDAAWEDAGRRGFTLPSGMLLGGVRRARQAASDNLARASTDIAIKNAELEQANLQFAVQQSASFRQSMVQAALSYHGSLVTLNGQALDAAKSIVSTLIEAYNATVRAFQTRLEAYKADAAVYETRLKSAMAGIELYQAEIKALQALADVDQAKVRVYSARIDSLQALANVYRARIDAVKGRADLEKLKIDLFQARVQAYGARVQAKNSEFEAFKAAIQGEEAKVSLFGQQVQAYGQRVQAFRGIVDARAESVRAQVSVNQARADTYRATVAGYSAVVQATGEVARTQLENQRQKVIAFQASAQAVESRARMHSDFYKATADIAIKHYATDIDVLLKTSDQQFNRAKAAAELGLGIARVYEGIGNAALSGMNTLVSQQLVQ